MKNFLKAITQALNELNNSLDPSIHLPRIVEILGSQSGVDRCYIFKTETSPTGESLISQIAEWTQNHISVQIMNPDLQDMPFSLFDGLEEELLSGEIMIGQVRNHPNTNFREIMTSQDILTYVFAPIIIEGLLWGFIGFDNCTNYNSWSPDQVDAIQAVASTIAIRIHYYRLYQEKKKYVERFEISSINSGVGVWEYNLITKEFFYSGGSIALFEQDQLDFKNSINWKEFVHPNDYNYVVENFNQVINSELETFEVKFRLLTAGGSFKWIESKANFMNGDKTILIGTHVDISDRIRQEEIIKHQNKFLEELTEKAEFVCCIADENDDIVYLNKLARDIIGESLLHNGKPDWSSLMHPEDEEVIWNYYYSAFKTPGVQSSINIRFVDPKSKETRNYRIIANNQLSNDSIKGVMFFGLDITNALLTERRLANTEYRLNSIVSSMEDIAYSIDIRNDKMVFIGNPENLLPITGFTYDEIEIDHSLIFSRIHDADKNHFITVWEETALGPVGKINEVQLRYNHPEKGTIHLLNRFKRNEYGENKTIDGIISDITANVQEKMKTELELRDSKNKLEQITNNIHDMICVHDWLGNLNFVSPSCKIVNGFEKSEMLGKSYQKFIAPEFRGLVDLTMEEVKNTKTSKTIDFQMLIANGAYNWVEVIFSPVLNEQGIIQGIQSSTRNVEDRKRAEFEIQKNLEKERELNELKAQFVSMASHQFRTPLSIMHSNTELLDIIINRDDTDLSRIKKISETIRQEISRITKLMENILVFGRLEANIRLDLQAFDAVQKTEEIIEAILSAKSQSPPVITRNSENIPFILADELLFSHVITNIISNAYEYSTNTSKSPEIDFTYDEDLGMVKICMKDYGIGIPKDEINHVFDSFYRASNTQNIKGSGLGLIICKQFTEKMNGSIELESELNKGTLVKILLPTAIT